MPVSTARHTFRRIFLVAIFCGIGYGVTQVPGLFMEYTLQSHTTPKAVTTVDATGTVTAIANTAADRGVEMGPENQPAMQSFVGQTPTQNEAPPIATNPANAEVIEALRTVIDPELGINIVDLGLIREITQNAEEGLSITIIPTSPLCPYLKQLVAGIKNKLAYLAAPGEVGVTVDMERRWTPDDLSAEGRRHFFGSRP